MRDGQESSSVTEKRAMQGRRKALFLALGCVVAVCLVGSAVWFLAFAGRSVSTDDAYTAVEVAQITPLVEGPVKHVYVVDTQPVHSGDVLVTLDDTDARIAVAQAEAELDRARRQVRQIMQDDSKLSGQMSLDEAKIRSAQSAVAKARADFDKATLDEERRRKLVGGGSVSEQEFTDSQTRLREASATLEQAQAEVAAAHAALSAASGARQSNAALFIDSTVETNPIVVAAKTNLEQARVNLDRTVLRSPVDGIVTQRDVAMGQRVHAGARLMTIVPIGQIYVDANFKEVELGRVRPGQEVRLTSDLYGRGIVYHGQVVGFEGGTGSALSLIPAQNATGNWIKVVQRLPVRIRIDPAELDRHPLRVGLSMEVSVELTTQGQVATSKQGVDHGSL